MNPVVAIIIVMLVLLAVSVFFANYFGIIKIFPEWSATGMSNNPPPPPSDTGENELPPLPQ